HTTPLLPHAFPTRRSSDLHLHSAEKEEGHDQRGDAGRGETAIEEDVQHELHERVEQRNRGEREAAERGEAQRDVRERDEAVESLDRKSTRLNSSHVAISYA